MNISAGFIRKPIATTLLMVAIVLLGILGYELLPVAALPDVEDLPDHPGDRRICRARIPRRWHLPQLADVASDQQSDGRTLTVEVNRQFASRLGVDPAIVDFLLYDAFGQRHVARIYTTLNQDYVILEVDPSYQLGPNALSRIDAKSASGAMVPLSQFASVRPAVAALAINHQGQFPSVTLSFNLAQGNTIGGAVAAIWRAAADFRCRLQSRPVSRAVHRRFRIR